MHCHLLSDRISQKSLAQKRCKCTYNVFALSFQCLNVVTEIVFSYKIVQHPYFNKLSIYFDENKKEDVL